MPASVPSISSDTALAPMCAGEPCSSGAPMRPFSPARLSGETAHGRQSNACWAANTTSSSNTKARLALNARQARAASARRWPVGSGGTACDGRSMVTTWARRGHKARAARGDNAGMDHPNPVIRLRNPWRSAHPWIFQKLVEKPAQRPKPGSIVDIVGVDGAWVGRGFYNGHSRIALRILETDPDVAVDQAWFERRIAAAVALRRDLLRLDEASNAWRVVHSEGDGLSGLVVDRYDDLLVLEFFSAGMFRHREWIYEALRAQFPGCRFHASADEHVQKQESFDFRGTEPAEPAIITEHGIRFRADPAGAHKTGFFADQRDNREWLSRHVAGKRVLDLCCNTGGFGVYAAVRGAAEVTGIDIDEAV